jgi:hypothetical protein
MGSGDFILLVFLPAYSVPPSCSPFLGGPEATLAAYSLEVAVLGLVSVLLAAASDKFLFWLSAPNYHYLIT